MVRKKTEEKSTEMSKATLIKEKMNKLFKKKILTTYADKDDVSIPRLSSGILALDLILGGEGSKRGWPVGRSIEIYGPESVGKSSLILQTIAGIQSNGDVAALIDVEHALDPIVAQSYGVDIENLLVSQPDSAEDALELAVTLADEPDIKLIAIDSIAMLAPDKELEGDMEDQQIGLQARLISKFFRKISPKLNNNGVTLLMANQLTSKISGHGGEQTIGGKRMRYVPSVRLEIRRAEDVEVNGVKIGHIINCRTAKNKTAAPQQVAQIFLQWGVGFSREFDLVNLGLQKGIIQLAGAWFAMYGEKYQGRNNLMKSLEEDKELSSKLEKEILEV